MQLKTQCPKCQKTLRCPAERVGTLVRCPGCKHKFRVTSTASGSTSMAAEPSMEVRHTIDSAAGRRRDQPSGSEHGANERSGSAQSGSIGSRRRQSIADLPSLGRFGHYDLKSILGSGGFGVVYRAWDTQLGRQVAIKVPRFDVSDQRKLRRFRQEACAAAKLQHPGIVAVITEGVQGGKPFIVAEFVDGEPLAARIDGQRPDRRQAVLWVRDLALALDYAHDQGVVHRDIKPDNVMLASDGRPRIMDFGLAKQIDEDSSLSIDGSVLGTPSYMAPEQARGEISLVNERSDQYSLGAVLYELLTGAKPFNGPPHAVLAKVADMTHEPPPPRSLDASLPKDLEAICWKAIAKQSAARYESLGHLAADLDRWLDGKPTLARPLSRPLRAARWCRRNPALAGSGATILIASLLITLLTWHLLQREPNNMIAAAAAAVEDTADAESSGFASGNSTLPQASQQSEPTLQAAPVSAAAASQQALLWQPTPQQQAYIDQVAQLPVESQAAAVALKLQEVNPGFDGEFSHKIANGQVREFQVSTEEISDIWPVRALAGLSRLIAVGTGQRPGKLADLSPLAGMKLTALDIDINAVADLSPLAGMPLAHLAFHHNRVSDLSALAEMPLALLSCYYNPISNLSPIRDLRIRYLNISGTHVVDLSPLAGMPLANLDINNTRVSDISVIEGAQLRVCNCSNTLVADLRPLAGNPLDDLKVSVPAFHDSAQQFLKSLPLKTLGRQFGDSQTVEAFWQRFHTAQSEAVSFSTEAARLPVEEQQQAILSKLRELNGTDNIDWATVVQDDAITEAAVRLDFRSSDLTPLRSLGQLRKLAVAGGPGWLDLSPINASPISELICSSDQALRNRLMLAEIATLKSINGEPALQYLESLVNPKSRPTPDSELADAEILAAHPLLPNL